MGFEEEMPEESEEKLMGGFSDEPMEFPGFGKGQMPGFMGKGPMPMDGTDMPEGVDGMPMNPLMAVKNQIATITDIDGVKGVLNAIIEMMIAKMETMDDKPPMGDKPGKGKKGNGAKGGKGGGKGGKEGGKRGKG